MEFSITEINLKDNKDYVILETWHTYDNVLTQNFEVMPALPTPDYRSNLRFTRRV